jgi:hypothetical protein
MANGSISVARLCRRIVETPRRALALVDARHSLQDVSLKLSLNQHRTCAILLRRTSPLLALHRSSKGDQHGEHSRAGVPR